MSEIRKTSAIQSKEAELKAILKEHSKIAKQLDKVKQKLADMQQVLIDSQSYLSKITPVIAKFRAMREQLLAVFQSVIANKKLPKSERKNTKFLFEELSDNSEFESIAQQFEIDPETAAQFAQENEESRKSRFDSMFGQYRPPTPESEQQQIRKVYLRLANQFHPDKTQHEIQAEQFHTIMQNINEAYSKNDLGALLALEKQYAAFDFTPPAIEQSSILQFLNQQIDRLQSEITLLQQQINRTKAEIAALSNSEQGLFIAENLKALKRGETHLIDQLITEIEEKIVQFDMLIKGYTYYNEHGEFSADFMEGINEEEMYMDETEEEMSEEEMALYMAFQELLEGVKKDKPKPRPKKKK